jgi:8-oxo-dGTP pyrophosphatase MutT (NUDIX family)
MLSIESKLANVATANDLPQRLAVALGGGERGAGARTRMSPQLSYGRHAGPAPATSRAAAVILLLFQRAGHWMLPLTERPISLPHHGGQISLPGGAVDDRESSCEAALRELGEELGFHDQIELLGRLCESYVFASDYSITPWLAYTRAEVQWQPQADEVQSVLEVPIDSLLGDDAIGRLTIERGPLVFHAPCIRAGEARIWGATSIILSEFAEVFRLAASDQ